MRSIAVLLFLLAIGAVESTEIVGSTKIYSSNGSQLIGAINFLQTGKKLESFIVLGYLWGIEDGRYIGIIHDRGENTFEEPCSRIGPAVTHHDKHLRSHRPTSVFFKKFNDATDFRFIAVDDGGSLKPRSKQNVMNRTIVIYKIEAADMGLCFVTREAVSIPVACGIVVPGTVQPGGARIPDFIETLFMTKINENEESITDNDDEENNENEAHNGRVEIQADQANNTREENQADQANNTRVENQENQANNSRVENQENQANNSRVENQGNQANNSRVENQGNQANNSRVENQENQANNSRVENQGNQANNSRVENQENQANNSRVENQGNQANNSRVENQENQANNSRVENQENQANNSRVENQENQVNGETKEPQKSKKELKNDGYEEDSEN